jgi:fatty-acyl-CoA synthase
MVALTVNGEPVVVAKMTPLVSEEDIKAEVLPYSEKGVISKFAIPQRILFVDALAKTSVGKFDKRSLRAQYGDRA